MITGIRLENFQGYLGRQEVRFGQVSLLMGANSSGKSSIGRALRILAQTLDGKDITDENPGVRPVLKGDRTDLSKEQLGFGGPWGNLNKVRIGLRLENIPFVGSDVHFGLEWSEVWREPGNFFEIKVPWTKELLRFELEWENDEVLVSYDLDVLLRAYREHPCPEKILLNMYERATRSLEGSELNPFDYYLPEEIYETFMNFPHEANDHRMDFFLPLVDAAEKGEDWAQNHNELHIAQSSVMALRSSLIEETRKAVVPFPGSSDPFNNTMQRALIMHILSSCFYSAKTSLESARFLAPTRQVPDFVSESELLSDEMQDRINEDLFVLTAGRYEIVSHPIKALDRSFWQYALMDSYTGVATGFDSVGQGFTQLLDVLIALESDSGFVFLQQPDLHLHPKIIAQLTDLVVAKSKSTQILIETHSETILNRLQKNARLSQRNENTDQFNFSLIFSDSVTPKVITNNDLHELDQLCNKTGFSSAGYEELKNVFKNSLGSNLRFTKQDIIPNEFDPEPVSIDKELQEFLLARVGFNSMRNMQIDYLGDLLDPLPLSFSDLRVQDLIN